MTFLPNLKDVCEALPGWAHLGVMVLIFLWEFLLGETRFGSTVRIFVTSIATAIKTIKGKKDENDL